MTFINGQRRSVKAEEIADLCAGKSKLPRFNWKPLSRWQRFKRFFGYYLNPYRACMVCGKRFWNRDFWRYSSWHWGVPEYCSKMCWDEELDSF